MKGKLLVIGGAAVGYVVGTRAGRERYEQLKGKALSMWRDPHVQNRVTELEDAVKDRVPEVKEKVSGAAHRIADKTSTVTHRGDAAHNGAGTGDALDRDRRPI